MPKIWTDGVRLRLFQFLVQSYGPQNTWEKKTLPGHGRDEDYREFLADFAKECGAKSGKAVGLKVDFARCADSPNKRWGGKDGEDAKLSIAAAQKAGFIPSTGPMC